MKDKYTTIKEKVEKRSREIEERANIYDACLEPYIEKMNNDTLIYEGRDSHQNLIEKKIAEVLGPEEEDGRGCFIYKVYTYEVGEDDKKTLKDINFSLKFLVNGMWPLDGGFWNASDYAMSSIALGVSQLSKVAPSTSNNSGTGNDNYTSALWGKIVSDS